MKKMIYSMKYVVCYKVFFYFDLLVWSSSALKKHILGGALRKILLSGINIQVDFFFQLGKYERKVESLKQDMANLHNTKQQADNEVQYS